MFSTTCSEQDSVDLSETHINSSYTLCCASNCFYTMQYTNVMRAPESEGLYKGSQARKVNLCIILIEILRLNVHHFLNKKLV